MKEFGILKNFNKERFKVKIFTFYCEEELILVFFDNGVVFFCNLVFFFG